ncbi:MAG TPA: FAD-dependent oxidoreductase [Allosphingosinicella sp.]|nr:FAD-dependent oxidoreductase [Allosphingosinicella sp.]
MTDQPGEEALPHEEDAVYSVIMAEPETQDSRREQRYPSLSPAETERLERFGTRRGYAPGEMLVRTGESGHGLGLILAGEVDITRHACDGEPGQLIVTHGPGAFLGELAQLSGQPALVDAQARGPVQAVTIPPERLRALIVAEAEIGERIMRALILRRVGLIESGTGGPILVGRDGDSDLLRLETYLSRNGHPHQRLDPDRDADARALVERFHVADEELPIVLCPGGQLLRNPTEACLARCLGLVGPIDPDRLFDVAVIGAGPAGLATAVYAASEGLSVLVLDCRAFGGQAGASARIENYLGFPTGISGMALMGRAFSQARKFGVEMAIPDEAVKLECDEGGDRRLSLANGERIRSRAIVLATGARYRRLDVSNLEDFEGASVHYWASPLEAKLVADQEVALVGGGNSAGQGVVFLAGHARRVTLVARRPLQETMSAYLVERIASLPNVELVSGAEVSALEGSGRALDSISWRTRGSDEEVRSACRHLFLFIGADPNTDWLRSSGLKLDPRGFILTGQEARAGCLPLETSRPGVFAVGDVRAASVKRVAAAVGDGAQVVAALHAYLALSPNEMAAEPPLAVRA